MARQAPGRRASPACPWQKAAALCAERRNPGGQEQRGSFATAAGQFGMDVRIPSDAELLGWGVSAGHLPNNLPASSAGEAIIVGTLDWRETLPGWTGKWQMRWQGADYAWGISGVNYDAAFRNIIRGVVLVASGVGSPDQGI